MTRGRVEGEEFSYSQVSDYEVNRALTGSQGDLAMVIPDGGCVFDGQQSLCGRLGLSALLLAGVTGGGGGGGGGPRDGVGMYSTGFFHSGWRGLICTVMLGIMLAGCAGGSASLWGIWSGGVSSMTVMSSPDCMHPSGTRSRRDQKVMEFSSSSGLGPVSLASIFCCSVPSGEVVLLSGESSFVVSFAASSVLSGRVSLLSGSVVVALAVSRSGRFFLLFLLFFFLYFLVLELVCSFASVFAMSWSDCWGDVTALFGSLWCSSLAVCSVLSGP